MKKPNPTLKRDCAKAAQPLSSTLGALIIEEYGRFSFMQTPSRTIEQIATHFIRTLRNERQASSRVRALASNGKSWGQVLH